MPNTRCTDVTRDTVCRWSLRVRVLRLPLDLLAHLGGLSEFFLGLRGLVGQFADGFVAFFSTQGHPPSLMGCLTVGLPGLGLVESGRRIALVRTTIYF